MSSTNAVVQIVNLQNSVLDLMGNVNEFLINGDNAPAYSVESLTRTNDKFKHFNVLDEMLTKKLIEIDRVAFNASSHNLEIIRKTIMRCINQCINLITIKHYNDI
ncbi:ORF-69 [Catopsilia pomona nucleopolyhedrovirus]|uniref:ORF-69 n=1 Tax=Catopsilia pomona nucleopolyhedrovirus TaxID=1850906 RepID=A0A172WZD2_9ABAC|nr:ORF-69 [Catopsilia pomona nucleopolyhedrovirus]ANF29717.1 ORF-69 [Catopsilia pomona nucleopolyhedrovirus]